MICIGVKMQLKFWLLILDITCYFVDNEASSEVWHLTYRTSPSNGTIPHTHEVTFYKSHLKQLMKNQTRKITTSEANGHQHVLRVSPLHLHFLSFVVTQRRLSARLLSNMNLRFACLHACLSVSLHV